MGHGDKKRIIIGISSTIGAALAKNWLLAGYEVIGSYRSYSEKVAQLDSLGASSFPLTFQHNHRLADQIDTRLSLLSGWNVLCLLPATMKPIDPFEECDLDVWFDAFHLNFLSQVELIKRLLPLRTDQDCEAPLVLVFAGSGTNDAPLNTSAYTVSKIALMKMIEILQEETPKVKFVIVGPGWIKAPIHNEMIAAGQTAGRAFEKTKKKYQCDDFDNLNDVIEFCDWLINAPIEAVGGRNFSVQNDDWKNQALVKSLTANRDLYKLRRFGNDLKFPVASEPD